MPRKAQEERSWSIVIPELDSWQKSGHIAAGTDVTRAEGRDK
jgi:hypothetical protein